ncbi:guanine deaminase [Glaciecola sp. 1036]|uniref:guanine deaminase n=1 Tax=Alteromonadaceae TaxID=72275 RepID=UPI003CFE670B
MSHQALLFRGNILHFPEATITPDYDFQWLKDGALIVQDNKIVALGEYDDLVTQYPLAKVHDHSGRWILPGFIDNHLHYPQTEIIGKFGEQLLTWLENFTFPTERQFDQQEKAEKIAHVFTRQLLKNGTTTGLVFSSVHKSAADTLFAHTDALNMQMVIGKVCMDTNCPEYLQDTPQSAQQDSAQLIQKWHGKNRNFYALTPRFSPTSTSAQLAALGELAVQYPDVFIQTHLSENKEEIAWVKSLYPDCDDYLATYEKYNLVRKRSVFGHCIHLSDDEWQRLSDANATAAFCPTSNLFLGSGLFDLNKAVEYKVPVAMATDVGGGTSFNLLRTYGEAYKVCQLNHQIFTPLHGLYTMTQGPAIAYGFEHQIGNLNPDTYADFIILNPKFDELSEIRIQQDSTPQDMLFAMSMLSDDRAIEETWIAGKLQYSNTKESPDAMA